MKVLHVVYCLDVGGLETFVIDLTKQYDTDVTSSIVCLTTQGILSSKFKGEIHYLKKSAGWSGKTFLEMAAVIKKVKPDLIHTHNQGANLYGSVAGYFCGVPVVYTKHGRSEGPQHERVLKMDRFSSFFTRKIVCVSDDVARLCTNSANVCASKVMAVPNGIDTNLYLPQGTAQPEQKEQVIGCVARLAPEKDHLTLLQSCLLLKQSGRNFKLKLVGDGSCREGIERYISQNAMEDYVELLGTRHDVHEIVPTFDIFAMSSITEGMSLTLLEAMSCALPVVTTRVGGNPEVVEDGRTGFLVESRAPVPFAEKLALLLDAPDVARRMGRAGRERVVEHFSLASCSQRYLQLYRSLVPCA
jgi:glycosyltransferase involved in cell wall biosynthesis